MGFRRSFAGTLARLCQAVYLPQDVFLREALHLIPQQWLSVTVFREQGIVGYYIQTVAAAHLVFQGTNDLRDLRRDLEFKKVASWDATMLIDPVRQRIPRVHAGFQSAWDTVRTQVLTALQSHPPQEELYLTGHSLGGAIAVLGSIALYGAGVTSELYTFGCPRVGDRRFRKLFARGCQLEHYRCEIQGDAVPHAPPFFFGFRHTGTRIYFARDGRMATRPTWHQYIRLALRGLFRWLDITSHHIADYAASIQKGPNG